MKILPIKKLSLVSLSFISLGLLSNVWAAAPTAACTAGTFAGLSIPVSDPDAAAVTSIQLGNGSSIVPVNDPSGVSLVVSPQLGTYCRVTGTINTINASQTPLSPGDNTSIIQFEVRLPNVWNGNYLQYAGSNADGDYATTSVVPGYPGWGAANTTFWPLFPVSATYSPNGGYAVSATDSGHSGLGLSAFLNPNGTQNTDRWINFAYRSRHLLAIISKQIIQDYYGVGPAVSFHGGTSGGGRSALVAAARYPQDFNAVFVYAPSLEDGARVANARIAQAQFPGITPSGCNAANLTICLASQVIPTSGAGNLLPVIANATMSTCDAQDGLVDGIISPINCDFNPLTDVNLNSLTPAQRNVLNSIYTDTVFPGVEFPRYVPGYENASLGNFGIANTLLGVGTPPASPPSNYPIASLRAFIYPNDPNVYVQGIDLNLYASDLLNWASCPGAPGFGSPCSKFDTYLAWNSATDTDLSAFKANGGKLLIVHGLVDKTVGPLGSLKYYNEVTEEMGGLDNTRDFVRLFLVPGRAHVANGMLQSVPGVPGNVGLSAPVINNGFLKAMEQWVDTGTPPDSLLGTDFFTPPAQPTITRPICAYPFKAVYTGPVGDTAAMKVASNFVCRFYDLKGLFSPVDNLPVLNEIKAGQAIPVKFSLGGDWGLNIMAVGFPKSEVIACNATVSVNGVDETVSTDESGLQYDPSSDQYKYVWKTNKSWKDSCRQLVIRLNEGTTVRANFTFK